MLYLPICVSQFVYVDLYFLHADIVFVSTLKTWREYSHEAKPLKVH